MTSLTEKAIRDAKPGDVLKDDSVTGLSVRANTTSKSYFVYYRTKAGVERRPKIGDAANISLPQARKIAREMLAAVALGGDPAAKFEDARNEPTVQDLWDEYWKRHGSKKKVRSGEADDLNWRLHLAPRFAKLKLSAVNYSKVSDMMEDMVETPYAANRSLALMSKMFNFGIAPLRWAKENPVKGVRRYPETKRERYLSSEETSRLVSILDRESVANPASVAFIYLLILTGARKGEIADAKWDWIDGNVLNLPDSKTGKKPVYLPPQALEVLDRLPQTNGTITGISSPVKLWQKIRRDAGCPDLRIHDLRHSFASAALAAGLSLAQIGELLGHKSEQTTKRYAHLIKDVGVAAATATADNIMARVRPQPLFIEG
jgi:integrase